MRTGKIVWSVFGICSGVLSIIASIIVWTMSIGEYEWNEAYGGDAYTGIQNAAAQAANNVQDLAELIRMGLGFGLLIFGIAMICYFTIKICEISGQATKMDKISEEITFEASAESNSETTAELVCEDIEAETENIDKTE